MKLPTIPRTEVGPDLAGGTRSTENTGISHVCEFTPPFEHRSLTQTTAGSRYVYPSPRRSEDVYTPAPDYQSSNNYMASHVPKNSPRDDFRPQHRDPGPEPAGSDKWASAEKGTRDTKRRRSVPKPSSPILFYDRDQPYYESGRPRSPSNFALTSRRFTNFSPYAVTLDGRRYPTAEHRELDPRLISLC
jgi:hypothetical protein